MLKTLESLVMLSEGLEFMIQVLSNFCIEVIAFISYMSESLIQYESLDYLFGGVDWFLQEFRFLRTKQSRFIGVESSPAVMLCFLLLPYCSGSGLVSYEFSSKSPLCSRVFAAVTPGSPFFLLFVSLDYSAILGSKCQIFSDLRWIGVFKHHLFLAFLHAHLREGLADTGYRFRTKNSSSDIIKFFVESKQELVQPFPFNNLSVPQAIFGAVPLTLFEHIELLPIPDHVEVLGYAEVLL